MRRAVIQFVVGGLVAVVLLGVVSVEVLRRTGTREAVRDAKRITALAGRGIVAPNLTSAVERGDPAAIRRLDRIVRRRILDRDVVRIKVWTRDGRVVYSDEHRLIGSRYRLGDDDLEALDEGRVDAEVSDLERPENRFERRYGKLLEVYLPVRDRSGRRLLFESYQRFSSVSASGHRLWLAFAPAILGALFLLYLVQLPLALRLARGLRESQAQREQLLRRAIDSSELERRRIARDLHDGAVQNLAGVSYSLSAAAEKLNGNGSEAVKATVREAAAETRRTIRELRSLLVDIYPPDLHREGLASALGDLVARLSERGVDVRLDVAPDLELPPEAESLLFRTALEGIRNVVEHAEATRVDVRVRARGRHALLEIEDDGHGFDPETRPEGHLGLRLLADLARDAGGDLQVRSAPGRGTCLRLEAPLA